MRDHHRILDAAFIADQRSRLLAARDRQSSAINGDVLAENLARRTTAIERALAKIEDGTYGVSDVTGRPIPMDRLCAVPEAICTLAEE
jgi:RNA polymerase-binding transcription factor DksA